MGLAIMIDDAAMSPRQTAREAVLRAAALAASKGDYGTLVLDGAGTIRSCGTAAAELFGGDLAAFAGMPISSLIADFGMSSTSASYSARYFAHLCAEGHWRSFRAVDVQGREFPIELSMSRVRSDGQDLILLNLRRAAPASPSPGR